MGFWSYRCGFHLMKFMAVVCVSVPRKKHNAAISTWTIISLYTRHRCVCFLCSCFVSSLSILYFFTYSTHHIRTKRSLQCFFQITTSTINLHASPYLLSILVIHILVFQMSWNRGYVFCSVILVKAQNGVKFKAVDTGSPQECYAHGGSLFWFRLL